MKTQPHESPKNRREFLARCGKYAIVTPPAVTLMLAASSSEPAIAGSGFHDPGRRHFGRSHDDNGFGNGGGDGVPGHSDHRDAFR